MQVAIIGAGALGSLIAGLLGLAADSQDEIYLVGPSPEPAELVEKFKDRELIIEPALAVKNQLVVFKDGAKKVGRVHLITDPAQASGCQLAIILVKSYRSYDAGLQAAALLAPNGVVLSLQNGLGNLEMLSRIPALQALNPTLAQGVTTIGAVLEEPGRVRLNGAGLTSLPLLEQPSGEILEWFKTRIESLGLAVTLSPEVESLVWGKLVVNCAGNALTALLDLSNEALLSNQPAWEIAIEAGQEVAELARLKGIKLPYPYEKTADQIRRVVELNPTTYSSMCQSVRKGRPTEIEALNGAVVVEAEKLGYSVPVNKMLAQLIRALEARRSIVK